jgi:DNA-binding transcriptional regulator LsrR (DeoR family)
MPRWYATAIARWLNRPVRPSGAVGDILGCFYDRDGNILSLDLHDHVVAVKPSDLKRIPASRRRRRGGRSS